MKIQITPILFYGYMHTIALPWYKGVAIEDSGKNLYELAARNNIF